MKIPKAPWPVLEVTPWFSRMSAPARRGFYEVRCTVYPENGVTKRRWSGQWDGWLCRGCQWRGLAQDPKARTA